MHNKTPSRKCCWGFLVARVQTPPTPSSLFLRPPFVKGCRRPPLNLKAPNALNALKALNDPNDPKTPTPKK